MTLGPANDRGVKVEIRAAELTLEAQRVPVIRCWPEALGYAPGESRPTPNPEAESTGNSFDP